jgi:hypothetical protein
VFSIVVEVAPPAPLMRMPASVSVISVREIRMLVSLCVRATEVVP